MPLAAGSPIQPGMILQIDVRMSVTGLAADEDFFGMSLNVTLSSGLQAMGIGSGKWLPPAVAEGNGLYPMFLSSELRRRRATSDRMDHRRFRLCKRQPHRMRVHVDGDGLFPFNYVQIAVAFSFRCGLLCWPLKWSLYGSDGLSVPLSAVTKIDPASLHTSA